MVIHYVVWSLTVFLYIPVFSVLYCSRWSACDYEHAYFILPVSFYLVWRKRAILKEVFSKSTCNNIRGLFVLLFGIFLFIMGWRNNYTFLATLSIVPVLYGLVGYLYGSLIVKQLLFPILYLLLLVPIPPGVIDDITLPMRYGVSAATEVALKLFHYPIEREGLLLFIGNDELFMGQPCSGFRALTSMLSLGLVYVHISRGTMLKKGISNLFIIPLALTSNLIRVIAICLITYYFGVDTGQGFFHSFSGIVVFGIVILGLFAFDCIWDSIVKQIRSSKMVHQ